MTTKLNRIKSALRESIEIAEKATDGPWATGYDNDTGKNDDSFWEWWEAGPARCEGVKGAADATFIAHARTMTPLACKALLLAIEGLERITPRLELVDDSICENYAETTLTSITSTWPDA